MPAIRAALETTRAQKIYVCNLRPQIPETEGYDAAAHVEALAEHGVEVDVVLLDPSTMARGDMPKGPECVEGTYARTDGLAHDPARVAAALADRVR